VPDCVKFVKDEGKFAAAKADCKEKDKGKYSISIILQEVAGVNESVPGVFVLTIKGFTTSKTVFEVKRKPKVYPAPIAKITKITSRGLMTIEWNMPMRVPSDNKLKSIPTDRENWFDRRGFP